MIEGTRIEYTCINECGVTIVAGDYGIFGIEAQNIIDTLDISNSKMSFPA